MIFPLLLLMVEPDERDDAEHLKIEAIGKGSFTPLYT